MNKINKKIVIPSIITLAVVLASIYGGNYVFANDAVSSPPIISKIAQKFNLNEQEVNEVFEQERQEMWQNRQKIQEERLNQAVTDGIITQEQKTKLLEKMNEWQADKTTQRQEHREEMQTWMEKNGIDHDKLREYLGMGGRKGFGGRMRI